VTLLVRASEVSTSAGIAVRSPSDGTQIAAAIGSTPSAETREITGAALVATVRDAVNQGRDITVNLNLVPPTGSATASLQIDFVALSIEYQASPVGAQGTATASPAPGSPTSGGASSSPTPSPTGIAGSGGSTNSAAGAGSATLAASAAAGGGSSPTSSNQPGSAAMGSTSGVWLDLPPAIATARFSCPAGGAWSLLYWNGPNDTSISVGSLACTSGDRFWVFRSGRWLGYSPSFAAASDSWNALTGEAHFVRGRAW
jgi:hypothetical protein